MADRATVKQQNTTRSTTNENVSTEVSRVGVITIAAFGVLVGVWSLACLVAGMAASGGPLAFVGDWFRAVTGM